MHALACHVHSNATFRVTAVSQVKAKAASNVSEDEFGDDDSAVPTWAFEADEDEHAVDSLMGIAEVCERYGVSPRALRFYETKGLLAPRRINGTRVYSKVDRARLKRILRAKSLGSPLSEIKQYLDMYGQHGEGRIQQLTYVIEKTDKAIAELEAKRAQIDASLAELRMVNERSRNTLEGKRKSK